MKTIQFLNKNYECPTAWNEITIRKQIEVGELADTQSYVKSLGVISAYIGIPIAELKTAKTEDVIDIMANLNFINDSISIEPLSEFNYNGKTYNVNETILKQEFQDYVAAQTAIAEYKDTNWKLLSYLTAIMAKQSGESLDDFDVNERAEQFLDLDVETCNRVSAFFLTSQKALELISVLSSPAMVEQGVQGKIRELESSVTALKAHRGGNLRITLWTTAMRMYIRYLRKVWAKSSSSPQSNNSMTK